MLNCLVQNEPGVLSRVSGILAGRGFNIDSLVVCRTEIRDLSRMSIVITGQDGVVEQARRQLEDLVRFVSCASPLKRPLTAALSQVPVWAVLDYTDTPMISRELLLVKLSILGPEYLDDQLSGGPSHKPWAPVPPVEGEQAEALAQSFEHSGEQPAVATPTPLTAAEALHLKNQYLGGIATLAKQFDGKIVDISEYSVIVEMSGKTKRVEAFLKLVRPFGILESARTGPFISILFWSCDRGALAS